MTRGTIFSIEEFAINDGPGIRTTVFLKGCPLRCQWCHNPEGLNFGPEPITKKEGVETCGWETTALDLARRLLRQRAFLEMNGGGITLTGGEPLAQAPFLTELLDELGPIHTAIETSGHAPAGVFRRVASRTDLILFDVKHTDPATHKRYTGVDNWLILGNLRYLAGSGRPFVVRIPLIPGVNDTEANLEKVADLIKDAKGLQRVELLRYHKTAGAKYAMVGREYAPSFDTGATPRVHDVFGKYGIKTIIL